MIEINSEHFATISVMKNQKKILNFMRSSAEIQLLVFVNGKLTKELELSIIKL